MSPLARVGVECVAPIKRDRRREYVNVRVTHVSDDGHVVRVEALRANRKGSVFAGSFPASALRPLGTPTPLAGVVF